MVYFKQSIDQLMDHVEAKTDVVQAAMVLIAGIIAHIRASANNPTEMQALMNQLGVSADRLAIAVAANTSAANLHVVNEPTERFSAERKNETFSRRTREER